MDIVRQLEKFYRSYGGEKCVAGKSVCGRDIYAFFVGRQGGKIGICQYAIHAREWATALIALEQMSCGIRRGGAWFIPLMNPDGAALCQRGLRGAGGEERKKFLVSVNGGNDFSLWKANAEGVDLNVNFDALWGEGEKNVRFPARENYIGSAPFCAAESAALRDFTLRVKPSFTVSYHCLGEEIYWYFRQGVARAARDKKLASVLAQSTGYPLRYTPKSAGGYKDWCIRALKIPAFTVEAGEGKHPVTEGQLPAMIEKNRRAIRDLTDYMDGFA